MKILEIKNITINYDDNCVVDDCSFNLKEGEILAVLGASGDGKTTLLKSIAGLLPIASGEVFFKGIKNKDSTEQLIPGHELIKLVNQDFDLDLFHSVEENIRLKLLSYDEAYRGAKVNELLELTGLEEYKTMRSIELSGGQKQRLAIARALADDPELILLDEPFNQLDYQMKRQIGNHIRKYLRENNISAILVTHNGVEAMDWSDRIAFLKKGKILREDRPDKFYDQPRNIEEATFFGDLNELKMNGETVYFRPGQFTLSESPEFPIMLHAEYLNEKKLGWYTEYQFSFESQVFKLFSVNNIRSEKKFFIKPIHFID